MSFCKNTSQQLRINDPLNGLSVRERKRLENCWAKEFGDVIFPLFNEARFSVLYSENHASRPNNPVNVYLGLLILKSMFQQSDEEALDSLLFDIRYQYALHTTSMEEQPVSKNSLSNFRRALYEYETKTGRDLLQEEVEEHAEVLKNLLGMQDQRMRMDSLMISSSCKRLTRMELVYNSVSRMIHKIEKERPECLSETQRRYLNEGHHNQVIYRTKEENLPEVMETVIRDATQLEEQFSGEEWSKTEEYQQLKRVLEEQTEDGDGEGRKLRSGKTLSPDSLQNPTDPDAAYRTKNGKSYVGYVGNLVEHFNGTDSIVTHYDVKKATYSDQQFAKDLLEKSGKQENEKELLIDGAYYSDELAQRAQEQGIRMIPSGIVGREPKGDYSEFEIDETTHRVERCARGYEPERSEFRNKTYKAYFATEACETCPGREKCPVKKQKHSYLLKVRETQYHTAKARKQLGNSEYRKIACKRAGVEGLPSILRRKYRIDELPVRRLVRVKIWFGLSVEAINILRYCNRTIRHRKQQRKMWYRQHFCLLVHRLVKLVRFQFVYTL